MAILRLVQPNLDSNPLAQFILIAPFSPFSVRPISMATIEDCLLMSIS